MENENKINWYPILGGLFILATDAIFALAIVGAIHMWRGM